MKKIFLNLLFSIVSVCVYAQFQPAANIVGSSAIHKDSSIITEWATKCKITRGYINILDTSQYFTQTATSSNLAFFGDENNCIGYPQNIDNVVSLGDSGIAILEFENLITNGEGYDFAVFENGLQAQFPPFQYFLELAFVEVSSDGEHFVRFPATSLNKTVLNTYAQIDPQKINNLAGKYALNYGTPFDLEELKDSLNIDILNIKFVKIIDVVGCDNSKYCSYDILGNKIYDPFPTPFWTCGFDLAGVGVINSKQSTNSDFEIKLYPNPVSNILYLENNEISIIKIYDILGKLILTQNCKIGKNEINLTNLKTGIYILKTNKNKTYKFVKIK